MPFPNMFDLTREKGKREKKELTTFVAGDALEI